MDKHTIRNPFVYKKHLASNDNRCTQSRLLEYRDSSSYNDISNNQTWKYILVTPGLNNNFRYIGNQSEGLQNNRQWGTHFNVCGYDDEGILPTGDYVPDTTTAMKWWIMKRKGDVTHWRLKASGVKLTLQNPEDELTGHFEAVAIPMPTDTRLYRYSEYASNSALSGWILKSRQRGDETEVQYPPTGTSFENLFLENIKWGHHPTFKAGSLSELSNSVWSCPIHDTHNEFQELPYIITQGPLSMDTDMTLHKKQVRWSLSTRGESTTNQRNGEVYQNFWGNCISPFFDKNFLMWVIRIKSEPLKIQWEAKHIVEVMYGYDKLESTYMSQRKGKPKEHSETAKDMFEETIDETMKEIWEDAREHPVEALDPSNVAHQTEKVIDKLIHTEKDIRESETEEGKVHHPFKDSLSLAEAIGHETKAIQSDPMLDIKPEPVHSRDKARHRDKIMVSPRRRPVKTQRETETEETTPSRRSPQRKKTYIRGIGNLP